MRSFGFEKKRLEENRDEQKALSLIKQGGTSCLHQTQIKGNIERTEP
jgi:hypothetical protein